MVTASVTHTLSLLQNWSISLASLAVVLGVTLFAFRSRSSGMVGDQTLAEQIRRRISNLAGEDHDTEQPNHDEQSHQDK